MTVTVAAMERWFFFDRLTPLIRKRKAMTRDMENLRLAGIMFKNTFWNLFLKPVMSSSEMLLCVCVCVFV